MPDATKARMLSVKALDELPAVIAARYAASVTGIVANAGIILIIYRNRINAAWRSQCHFLIVILALVQMAIGAGFLIRTNVSLHTVLTGRQTFTRHFCVLANAPFGVSFAMLRVVLIAIAVDRLYVICRPLEYSRRKAELVVTVALLPPTAISNLAAMFWDVNGRAQVSVCTMGVASGAFYRVFSLYFNNVLTLFMFAAYGGCVWRLRRATGAAPAKRQAQQVQRRLTVAAMALLSVYSAVAFLPNVLSWCASQLFPRYGAAITGVWTMSAGLAITAVSACSSCAYVWHHIRLVRRQRLARRLAVTSVVSGPATGSAAAVGAAQRWRRVRFRAERRYSERARRVLRAMRPKQVEVESHDESSVAHKRCGIETVRE